METKTTFILFGGTGDLTTRKLVPAIASLVRRKLIDSNSTIIGIARGDYTDESYARYLQHSTQNPIIKEILKNISIVFLRGDVQDRELYKKLQQQLEKIEDKIEKRRIFYLATSFSVFSPILEGLSENKLLSVKKGFTRLLFEKPFGSDLASSKKLHLEIHTSIQEKDIFRVDHYLAKETVNNINVLKFFNPLFYGTFTGEFIDSIEINVLEDLGVGDRLEYYDRAGALKDMIQNHILQVLSLLLIEKPKEMTSEAIHKEKEKILRQLKVRPPQHHLLGQYEGYQAELAKKDFPPSKTETYSKIELECESKRWKGVNLILRTGKKLKEKNTRIIITYKDSKDAFSRSVKGIAPNQVIINVFPKQDVEFILNSREVQSKDQVRPIKFEFCYECEFGPNTVDEYSTLLGEAIAGDHMLFAQEGEIQEAWKIIGKIKKMQSKIPYVVYPNGINPELTNPNT